MENSTLRRLVPAVVALTLWPQPGNASITNTPGTFGLLGSIPPHISEAVIDKVPGKNLLCHGCVSRGARENLLCHGCVSRGAREKTCCATAVSAVAPGKKPVVPRLCQPQRQGKNLLCHGCVSRGAAFSDSP